MTFTMFKIENARIEVNEAGKEVLLGTVTVPAPVEFIQVTLQVGSAEEDARRGLKIEVAAASFAEPWKPFKARAVLLDYQKKRSTYLKNPGPYPPRGLLVDTLAMPMALRSPVTFAAYCLDQFGRVPDVILEALRKK